MLRGAEHLGGGGGLAPVEQQPGQGDTGRGEAGLELDGAAQGRLVAGHGQALAGGGQERLHEALDRRARLRADELGHHLALAEGLDRGDAADAVALLQPGVGVDVDLGEHHLALMGLDRLLEDGPQRAAGGAPRGPEVDDDGGGEGALQHLVGEGGLADLDDRLRRSARDVRASPAEASQGRR